MQTRNQPSTHSSSLPISLGWILKSAWRDARRNRRKLLLFASSVVFGVAAMVGVNAFRINLQNEVQSQSKELLGADFRIGSRSPFSQEILQFVESLAPSERSSEVSFTTMANFNEADATRLVFVKGLEGPFPWYGKLETIPDDIHPSDTTPEPVAIVDEGLSIQFGLEIGDSVKLGDQTFTIAAFLKKIPGDSPMAGTFAPRILIAKQHVESTGLIKLGSRVFYAQSFIYPNGWNEDKQNTLKEIKPLLKEQRVSETTVQERVEDVGETMDRMTDYLNLVGFISLLLGGLGISGSVSAYLKGKHDTVAILRTFGSSSQASLLIFGIQISLVALIGSIVGASIGIGIQFALPTILASFLPVNLALSIPWSNVIASLLIGWAFASVFAYIPLLPLRRITPLSALRSGFDESQPAKRDPWTWAIYTVICLGTTGLSIWLSNSLLNGILFIVGLALALLAIGGIGLALRTTLKRLSTKRFPFALRQGLMNLYRPNNRTQFLMITIGMGTFLIYTLFLSEKGLLQQGEIERGENQPNVILFGIQPDQKDGIETLLKSMNLEMLASEAIVTMRLTAINGETASKIKSIHGEEVERWALRREYRSTYRNYLREDEEITSGTFTPKASFDSDTPIPISIEERIVEALNLQLGDILLWDVQGLPIETQVTSIREVDWKQMKPNFFVVFPEGILEPAPSTFVVATYAQDTETNAILQKQVVTNYPNVSVVNLDFIIESLSKVFDKIAFAIRFMATFTIFTGLIALTATIITSRYQRVKESVLLRTLGCSSKQIRAILITEYATLGILASVSGILLSLIAGWALATFTFQVDFSIPWTDTLLTVVAVSLLTLVTGLLNSLGIASHPPLETLRKEA
ncbi:FtsX-like permease family protein [Puniceicoccaceae bacterium K14]|nr:FtsX-like permease family protein [Puniceicoccaceae bacterium K14]